jgi:hypothetical protein
MGGKLGCGPGGVPYCTGPGGWGGGLVGGGGGQPGNGGRSGGREE